MSIPTLFSKQVAELCAQSIDTVLFDLDGTLVDSVPDLAAAIDLMLQSIGKSAAGEAKVNRWVGNGASALVKCALEDSGDELEDGAYATAYSIFEFAYAKRLVKATGLYDGISEVLADLGAADIKMGLITNKPRRFTLPLLSALHIRHLFDDIICGDDLEHKKPHPLPIQTALKNLRSQPEKAIMVGDSISDIKAAAAAGVKSVAVTYGYNHGISIKDASNEVLADTFIDHIQQLLC